MISFKEFLLMENADYSEYGDKDATDLLKIAKDNLKDILKDNEVKSNEVKNFFIWGTIIIKYIDIYKKIAETDTNPVIDDDTKKIINQIKAIYGRMSTSKKKMGIVFNDGGKLQRLCNIIYENIGDYDDIPNLCTKLDKEFTTALETNIDELKSRKEIDSRIKNALNELGDNFDEKITDENDKKTLKEIINKPDKDENDLKKIEELKNKYSSKQGDGIPPTTGNSTEGGNSGGNTQASNSNISSSFSKDDWETLFKEKNEAEIKKILNKVASNTISKMEKILNDRASQVLKDKDLMKEDAQEELWNVINERINLGNGSYLERDKGKSVNMYKDGSVGKNDDGSINAGNANETFKHYKQEIEFMTSNVAGRIAEINGNRSFNSSDGKLNKLRNQVRSVVLDYHNELLDIKNEFDKKISKVGLFQRNKINKARQKEKDDERFNSSEQGEMYGSALKEKTNQIYNAFNSTLKRSQVKTFDDMVAKQIATLAASSMDAKSFAKSCMFKRVLAEDGKTMFVLKYLSNKGIKIPLFDGKDHKQSGLDAKAYSDAFNKFVTEIRNTDAVYKDPTVIKNLIDAINKETPENQANDNGLTVEANLIRKALKKDISGQSENNQGADEQISTNDQNVDSQNNNQDNPFESLKEQLRKMRDSSNGKITVTQINSLIDNTKGADKLTPEQKKELLNANDPNFTVTTKACDGLPIGARKYSRAIRRRMNYALNKYM